MAEVRGGQKMEATLKAIAASAKSATVRVGFLEEATYPDGTSVPMVAAILEFGRKGAGPWPFFRNMIAAKKGEWPAAMRALLVANDYDTVKTLVATGKAIEGQLQQSIRDTNSPPLKPSTIARKGFDKPLIDTGHLWNSVGSEVKTTT